MSKPLTGESSPYTRNKGKIKPVFHLSTGKLLLKGRFLFGVKTVRSDSQQTLNQAFLAMFTAVSQLKSTQFGLSGSQEMRISSVEKWA